jgi:tRNA A37 N6-isopentenylltransferase MiaA
MKFEAIAIVGQTASGKAEIAVKISRILRERGKEQVSFTWQE